MKKSTNAKSGSTPFAIFCFAAAAAAAREWLEDVWTEDRFLDAENAEEAAARAAASRQGGATSM